MAQYEPRMIEFKELIEIDGWRIKVYTITKGKDFEHAAFYKNVKAHLPNWLALKNSFNSDHENVGFLILNVGTEGIFTLINWWVGKNMLNSHVFLTEPYEPVEFTQISGDGLGPCVWEQAVMHHEGQSWTANFLKKRDNPDIQAYLKDVYNGAF